MQGLRDVYDKMPKELSYGAKLFYLFLHSRLEPGQSIALNEFKLGKEAKLGRKIVTHSKQALALAGLIKVTSGAIVSRHNPDIITLL